MNLVPATALRNDATSSVLLSYWLCYVCACVYVFSSVQFSDFRS